MVNEEDREKEEESQVTITNSDVQFYHIKILKNNQMIKYAELRPEQLVAIYYTMAFRYYDSMKKLKT